MSFLTTIDRPYFTRPDGKTIYQSLDAIWLNVGGERMAVPFTDLDSYELDAEDINEATELWVSYQGIEYEFPLPERDSREWDALIEIIDPT